MGELMAFFEPKVEELSTVFESEQITDAAFDYFRATGFPYPHSPLHVSMQEINRLAATPITSLLQSTVAYGVADHYHHHRWAAKVNERKYSPLESWARDKNLRKAINMDYKNGGKLGTKLPPFVKLVNGTQACANFRPGFALFLYRKFCTPNSVILDTSTGYGGRLVGFMASGCARYIGIDPNTTTHKSNMLMAEELGFADRVKLINLPAEDVGQDVLRGKCDFSFTSPPYFSKELYADEDTQSWKRYPTGEDWREGFLIPMMALQYAALKDGATAAVNIADVKIRGKTYPLERWTVEAGKSVGFTYRGTKPFHMNWRATPSQEEKGVVGREPVIVFRR